MSPPILKTNRVLSTKSLGSITRDSSGLAGPSSFKPKGTSTGHTFWAPSARGARSEEAHRRHYHSNRYKRNAITKTSQGSLVEHVYRLQPLTVTPKFLMAH